MSRKKIIKSRLPSLISILLSGVIPTAALNLFAIGEFWKWIIVFSFTIVLIIIFVVIDVMLEKDEVDEIEEKNRKINELENENKKLEHKIQILTDEKEKIQTNNSDLNKEIGSKTKEIQLLEETNKELEEKNKLLDIENKKLNEWQINYKKNSYAATGIVFSTDYKKILLAYHKKQRRWIPPGSHVDGVFAFHEIVLDSVKRETGYSVRFHESHDYEQYSDNNCCILPCPFSVQEEIQIEDEGHEKHFDFLYILVVQNDEEPPKPGTHSTRWVDLEQLRTYVRCNNTYPDVLQSMEDALKFIKQKEKENAEN